MPVDGFWWQLLIKGILVIQKFPQIEGRFNPPSRPLTILSVGHTHRWDRTISRILPPLFSDPLALSSVAYWLISVPQDANGAYNVARAYNDALWECESPVVIFSTGDSIIMPQLLWRAYGAHLETHRPVVALRADETGEGSGEAVANDHAIGDLMLMPRAWAIEAGGWDERMLSWGFSDYALYGRLEMIGHPPIVLGLRWEDRVLHLWHPLREKAWYREQNEKNRRVFHGGPAWTKVDFLAGRVRDELEKAG